MVTKILHDFQSTLSCQILMKFFSIWNMYSRMHGEFGDFFLEFFDLKISIPGVYQFFFWKQVSEAVSGQSDHQI